MARVLQYTYNMNNTKTNYPKEGNDMTRLYDYVVSHVIHNGENWINGNSAKYAYVESQLGIGFTLHAFKMWMGY